MDPRRASSRKKAATVAPRSGPARCIGEIAGTLTGGFAREALLSAGCRFVVQRVAELRPNAATPGAACARLGGASSFRRLGLASFRSDIIGAVTGGDMCAVTETAAYGNPRRALAFSEHG